MHNTVGDVSLTNISRETNYFHDLVQYLKCKKFSPFLSFTYVLSMFLNLRRFPASPVFILKKRSYQK